MYQAQVSRYQEIGITSASKERLILLAYEGTIKFLNQARMHIEQRNIAAKCDRISKAVAVIDELAASLNMEEGKEVAENLASLYEYMMKRLVLANLNSDPKILDEVLSLLKTLYSAWVEVIDKPGVSLPRETAAVLQIAA